MKVKAMKVLGFMSGTSLDAIDMAILETDGHSLQALGPHGEIKWPDALRDVLVEATRQARAWPRGAPEPEIFETTRNLVADAYFDAAEAFLSEHRIAFSELDLIGAHGQTVLHEAPNAQRVGRTMQLLNGQRLADRCGVPVAYDFRTDDVSAGGQGAPLAPIYHAALAKRAGLDRCAVLNIGGVANITLTGEGGLIAFDTGPGNGLIDQLVEARTGARCDWDGALAARGTVSELRLTELLRSPYLFENPPKSLDRYDFSIESLAQDSLEDACATLTAFTAECVGMGLRFASRPPTTLIVCGGGRRNPVLMAALQARLPLKVIDADSLGWRGDAIEAEAFAYLAARTFHGLPISFPGTTGVASPMTGGRIIRP